MTASVAGMETNLIVIFPEASGQKLPHYGNIFNRLA
jgi:hypothetical protein